MRRGTASAILEKHFPPKKTRTNKTFQFNLPITKQTAKLSTQKRRHPHSEQIRFDLHSESSEKRRRKRVTRFSNRGKFSSFEFYIETRVDKYIRDEIKFPKLPSGRLFARTSPMESFIWPWRWFEAFGAESSFNQLKWPYIYLYCRVCTLQSVGAIKTFRNYGGFYIKDFILPARSSVAARGRYFIKIFRFGAVVVLFDFVGCFRI